MARSAEIAWAAGLFEGEGSCGIVSGQRQSRLQLTMVDRDVVLRFDAIVGCGNVREYSYPPRKTVWQWSAQGREDVLHVVELFLPFMGERRREQALEVQRRATEITRGRRSLRLAS